MSDIKINQKNYDIKKEDKNDVQIQTISEELENERKMIDLIENEKQELKLKLNETEKLLINAQESLLQFEKEKKTVNNNNPIEEEIDKIIKKQVETKEIEFR